MRQRGLVGPMKGALPFGTSPKRKRLHLRAQYAHAEEPINEAGAPLSLPRVFIDEIAAIRSRPRDAFATQTMPEHP